MMLAQSHIWWAFRGDRVWDSRPSGRLSLPTCLHTRTPPHNFQHYAFPMPRCWTLETSFSSAAVKPRRPNKTKQAMAVKLTPVSRSTCFLPESIYLSDPPLTGMLVSNEFRVTWEKYSFMLDNMEFVRVGPDGTWVCSSRQVLPCTCSDEPALRQPQDGEDDGNSSCYRYGILQNMQQSYPDNCLCSAYKPCSNASH